MFVFIAPAKYFSYWLQLDHGLLLLSVNPRKATVCGERSYCGDGSCGAARLVVSKAVGKSCMVVSKDERWHP